MYHGAYRVAAEHYLVRREELLHPLVCHADASDPFRENLVSEAGETVLLLYQGRYSLACRLPQQGSGGVSADSDSYVRLEFVYHLAGLAQACGQFERQLEVFGDVLGAEFALEPRHRQAHYAVAPGRDFLHLHLALGSDEEYLRLRVDLLKFVGDGYGREDVPSRASAADDDSQFLIFHNRRHLAFSLIRMRRGRPARP